MATSENENILNTLRIFLESKDLQIENLRALVKELRENAGNEFEFSQHGNSKISEYCEINATDDVLLCCGDQCQCSCHRLLKSDCCTQTFESDFYSTDFTDSALDWTPDEGASVTVTDLIKEVADSQPSQNDYIYDEGSKMYYSPSTGYYYDWIIVRYYANTSKERSLLYEPYSRTYYKYDDTNNSYEFYYQMDCKNDEILPDSADQVSQKVSGLKLDDGSPSYNNISANQMYRDPTQERKLKKKRDKHIKKKALCDDKILNTNEQIFESDSCSSLEDGEIQSSSSDSGESNFHDIDDAFIPEVNEDSLDNWPPCIRAIIKESSSQKIGSLFLIPFTGGTIGREKNSTICIPDISISRTHAKISFDRETWSYNMSDLGSQNGTFINDIKFDQDLPESPHPLKHGDTLALGSCKLLIHIHRGNSTCNECEPGLVQAELISNQGKPSVVKTKTDREKERRQNLRHLKKKFGLEAIDYVENEKTLDLQNYQDRAEVRRRVVGSQNPYEKDAPASSLDVSVSSSNKGYQMLKKMGWQDGESIGTNESGIVNPIAIQYRNTRAGLGSDTVEQVAIPEDPRRRKWKKAQKRYHEHYTEIEEEVDY